MTHIKKLVESNSSEETEQLGETIGSSLRGGEIIEIISDLGGGKTTFTRGIAKGAGSTDPVASPTFTVSREYQAGQLTIHHFDFYRLPDAGLIAYELKELLEDTSAVIIIEWGEIVADVLPRKRVQVYIRSLGEEKRELSFDVPETYEYLISKVG